MTDLIPTTALGGITAREASFGALTVSENSGLGLVSLALGRGQVAPTPFGMDLPEASCAVQCGDHAAFWTGRGQWMIELPGRATDDMAAAVRAEAPGCVVTEQTDGFVAFEIASSAGGAPITALLEKLVNIDSQQLVAGRVVRTGMDHMTVFVIRRSVDRVAVLGMRSFAGALWHALETAAKRLEEEGT